MTIPFSFGSHCICCVAATLGVLPSSAAAVPSACPPRLPIGATLMTFVFDAMSACAYPCAVKDSVTYRSALHAAESAVRLTTCRAGAASRASRQRVYLLYTYVLSFSKHQNRAYKVLVMTGYGLVAVIPSFHQLGNGCSHDLADAYCSICCSA
eukprot:6207017-Pleurochrysis_carterae.AAC.1